MSAREPLTDVEERLLLATEATRLGIWELDPDTRTINGDARTRELFGFAPEVALGYDALAHAVHPDDRARVEAATWRALEDPANPIFDERFRISDARDQRERWLAARGKAVFDAAGRPLRLVGTLLDVTAEELAAGRLVALARASDELNSSLDYETTLRTAIDVAVPGLGDFGFFDVVEERDRVRRIARAPGDPRRQQLLDRTRWVRSTNSELDLCALSSGRPALHPNIDEVWMRRAAADPEHLALMRELRFCSMLTVPLVYHERTLGALTLFCGDSGRRYDGADLELAAEIARRAAAALQNARLYRDLLGSQERVQQAYATAREADLRKDQFLAMLGHELRNPLSPILTAVELMRLRDATAHSRERTIIERQLRHLTRLVDDLLDVSRITRGKVELDRTIVDLREAIFQAIEMTSPLLEERRHQLVVEARRGELLVEGDEHRLAQVVSNLLANAAKYSEPGGRVNVVGIREGDEVVLRVRDHGAGIDPEVMPYIFDLFSQGQRSLDRAQGGLGLGLAIVRSLVELHRGTVGVCSDGAGTGSEFVVRLPAAERARPAAEDAPPRSEEESRSRRRILVVDDNADAAEALAEALELLGHEVATALDGPAALEVAGDFRPEIALVDIGLPVMDGYELAQRLCDGAKTEAPVLIAVSGYGQPGDRSRSRRAGFSAHLVKPVDLDQVADLIDCITAGSDPAAPP